MQTSETTTGRRWVRRPDHRVFAGVAGGIVEKEMPLEASNLLLWNPDAKKGDRVGFKVIGAGAARKKVRVFKSSGEVVDR